MDLQNPLSLAAELRARALRATAEESVDLLFLAAEYERLAQALQHGPVQVLLPK